MFSVIPYVMHLFLICAQVSVWLIQFRILSLVSNLLVEITAVKVSMLRHTSVFNSKKIPCQ